MKVSGAVTMHGHGRGVFQQLCRERLQHVVQEKLSTTAAAEGHSQTCIASSCREIDTPRYIEKTICNH